MKINKKGEPRCEKGEVRIGNFFVKDEGVGDYNSHIRITDLNTTLSHRVFKRLPVGIWLTNMLERKAEETLKTYIAVLWSLSSVVPDDAFIKELMDSTKSCLERHPEWYGRTGSDEEALSEVEQMKEFEKDVKDSEE